MSKVITFLSRFYYELKNKLFEFWHGHPYLLSEEVEIICETRDHSKFKHLNDREIRLLIKKRISEMYARYKQQQKCKHEKWDCDVQIRTIECCACGKRAWIDDYRSLYN